MKARVARFISRRWSVPSDLVNVELRPMHGGLESSVTLATVAPVAGSRELPERLVVKLLLSGSSREADVYRLLWTHVDRPPSARVFGYESAGTSRYLYMEEVRPFAEWPWSDPSLGAAVCRELARFHESPALPFSSFTWNYDAELALSAESTLALALAAIDPSGARYWRRLGDLRRVVGSLEALRAELLSYENTVIHGDVHPGNVILRTGHPSVDVAFIDWGRARVGSPLEDVASWLHSLGCWEPHAKRRHDSLLRAYLESRSVRIPLGPELRRRYWLASASNGLGGAIRYHLAVVADPASLPLPRYQSARALCEWERVVRRAAALLGGARNGGSSPRSVAGFARPVSLT